MADTRHNIVLTMQRVMRELGMPVADEETCASTIGLPLKDCFRKIFPELTDDGAEHCAETYRQIFFANAKSLVPDMFPHVQETIDLLARLRREVPGIHIRTTLMVGFPGEGEQEFEELMDFTRQARFERMGAFAYSEEAGTWAAEHLQDDIPQDVKQERLHQLMALQEQISLDIQEQKSGQTLRVIVDREEDDYYIGRTQWDSPEVDPEVLIKKDKPLATGEFASVKITEALPFELIAEPV